MNKTQMLKLASILLFAGCSHEPRDGAGSTGAAAPPETVKLSGTAFRVVLSGSERTPVAGASVCADARCALTDADGHYVLDLAAGSPTTVTASKPGFLQAMAAHGPRNASAVSDLALIDQATSDALGGPAAGGQDPDRHGAILVIARAEGSGLAGVRVQSGGPGQSFTPPTYFGEGGAVDSRLEATGASGLAMIARIAPGSRVLRFHHPTRACRALLGWEASDESTRVPIGAGSVTEVEIDCSAK